MAGLIFTKLFADISYMEQIERGQRNPTLGVIHVLAKVLGAKASELLREGNL